MLEAKQKFYDRQIAHMMGCLESQVHSKTYGFEYQSCIQISWYLCCKFKAKTPYYYSTFEAEIEKQMASVDNEVLLLIKKIIVLGSGQIEWTRNRIWLFLCTCIAAKECGYETIMINCNPETVSTDFDTADKLYFEPVFWEHIYDIIQHENQKVLLCS
jgi:carbamoyl-phosphate synthase large subunit